MLPPGLLWASPVFIAFQETLLHLKIDLRHEHEHRDKDEKREELLNA